jgi:hypothetical protein
VFSVDWLKPDMCEPDATDCGVKPGTKDDDPSCSSSTRSA